MPKVDQCIETFQASRKRRHSSHAIKQLEVVQATQRQMVDSNSHSAAFDEDQVCESTFLKPSRDSQIMWDQLPDILPELLANVNEARFQSHTETSEIPISRMSSESTVVEPISSGSALGKRKRIEISSGSSAIKHTSISISSISDPVQVVDYVPLTNTLNTDSTGIETPVVIAHSAHHQNIFDHRNLTLGVQWEIARLVSSGRIPYDNIFINYLDKLKGTNAEAAPKVVEVLLSTGKLHEEESKLLTKAFSKEIAAKSPWRELDMEDEMLAKDPFGCLGHQNSWYGGKVQFIAKLVDENSDSKIRQPPKYKVVLERPQLGPSNRFARRFGSKRFLRIHIPLRLLRQRNHELIDYFSRPFILNGRVFRSYFAKDHNAFLVETNESFIAGRIASPGDDKVTSDGRMSLMAFLNWHNPMMTNSNQTMTKWAARFALGLSNSVPGPLLSDSNIHPQPEIISPSFTGQGKAPSEMEMTDGCGLANADLLLQLREKFEWETFPTAVQCRIGGAKGLILLHPDGRFTDSDSVPRVWVRPSQTKINYPLSSPKDPAQLIVDVLRCSRLRYPAKLSAETIINLAENGVSHTVFVQLMQSGLRELVQGLTTWDGEHAMEKLWYNIACAGGVMGKRIAQELGGESRARGFADREDEDDDDEDEDGMLLDTVLNQKSSAWWIDQISGCPSTIEETVMVLLDSGFTPRECPVLAERLRITISTSIDSFVNRYKINVPMSCEAFIVPDPFGVLQAGEIQIKSSYPLRSQDGLDTDVIIGDVLVTRHPCKLPTDVQKVKAVFHEKLRQYADVIVFSVYGDRSLASMLGGGDYDGDKVNVIWQPEIVSQFRNADPSFANPPHSLKEAFSSNKETVGAFLERLRPIKEPYRKNQEVQKFLLGALRDTSVVGTYSTYHDNAVYMLGYDSPETVRLAYMFCTCLDGSKTGQKVVREVYAEDKKKYGRRGPAWKESNEDRERHESWESNAVNAKRGPHLRGIDFIMDTIKRQAERERRDHLDNFDILLKSCQSRNTPDKHLAHPWHDALFRAKLSAEKTGHADMQDELDSIASHVIKVRVRHRGELGWGPRKGDGPKAHTKASGIVSDFTTRKIETRQDILRSISKDFHSGPNNLVYFDEDMVKRIKASYAYLHDLDMQKKSKAWWTRFPWDVAMRDLCEIKAKALGPSKTVTTGFYETMTIHKHARS